MSVESDRQRQEQDVSSRPNSATSTEVKQFEAFTEYLKKELEYVRQDRDALRDLLDRRDIEFNKLQKQWEQKEQQWDKQKEEFAGEISSLKSQVGELNLQLRQLMRVIPSSERGSQLSNGSSGAGGGSDDDGDGGPSAPVLAEIPPPIQEQKYLQITKRPDVDGDFKQSECATKQEWWESLGSDPRCVSAPATIFASQVFTQCKETRDFSFTRDERQSFFGRHKGLHSKKDTTTVYHLEASLVKITCQQESLSDLASGLSMRKAHCLGPAGSRYSWDCLATITTLVAEYAIPMERLAKSFNHPYFSSSNISRWFTSSAESLVDIYVAMGKALAQVNYINLDDTSTLVLNLRKEAQAGLTADKQMTGLAWEEFLEECSKKNNGYLLATVLEAFGRVSQRADGTAAKKGLNTTLISGRLIADDYRSTVYFYRSHFGQAGNLLSRIVEYRGSSNKEPMVCQGDSSSQNHLEPSVEQKVAIRYIGCTSHARRTFFRHREFDKELSFCILRAFALLAYIEAKIKCGVLTPERILRYRQRYSIKVWALMKSICLAVCEHRRHPLANNNIWKKGDKLYDACAYVLHHFDELTYYLKHAHINYDNNVSEQGLRGEKLIENSSYFRVSEAGRIALDVHRSLIASCNSCGLHYKSFLQYVLSIDSETLRANPAAYFPHVVARQLKQSQAPPAEASMTATKEAIFH